MKKYKLQKESTTSIVFQTVIFLFLIIASFYTLSTQDFDFGAFAFISLFSLLFIAMLFSSIKELNDKKEHFLEVDIQDDSVTFNAKILLFKETEAFTFSHYQEYGNYYGRIYTVIDGEKDACLYSREFKGNNYLNEKMMVEIYTALEAKYGEYKKNHPTKEEVKIQTTTKKLWGMFEMINVEPKSLYYSYNGNYDANLFFLLLFALVMALPAFLVNYDTTYFSPDMQELLYKLYFFTDFKEYKVHGADVAVIVWIGFYIGIIDIFFKHRFKVLFFMSYDENIIRVGEVAIALMTLLYAFILIAYFDGEVVVGLTTISIMISYLIFLAYMEYKKYTLSFVAFIPFFVIIFVNIIALVLWTAKVL